MAIEVVDRLVKEIDALSERLADFDKRLRGFESFAKAAVMLALVFGIAGGVGGYFLNKEAAAIQEMREDTVAITNLTTNVASLQKTVATISSDVERASLPVLVTRIKNFASATAPARYGWDDYQSDMQSLLDFAIQYLALARDKSGPINTADSDVFFSELGRAADAAQVRAHGLKNIGDKFYDSHVAAPKNFKDLLGDLQRLQSAGLTDDQLHCYMAAFPNWKYHITHDFMDSPNTEHCQKVIGLGPA
jgi:hypothetical protein